MKFSIFASDGTCPGASLASQYLFAREFPHTSTLCSCSSVHESRSTDLTLLMCVPIPLWIPEQRMQMKMPRFQLAHRGSARKGVLAMRTPSIHHCINGTCPIHVRLFLLQSAQLLFPSNFRRLLIVCALRAVLSAAGSTCLRDISIEVVYMSMGRQEQ